MVYVAIVLLIIGLGFLILEMLHPGIGVFGSIGVLGILAASVLACIYIPYGIVYVLIGLVILGAVTALMVRQLMKRQVYHKLILSESLDFEKSEIGDLEYFLGKEGTAVTPLRPFGTADFNGVRLDVCSSGEYIYEGSKIKVVQVSESKIIVDCLKNSN